MLKQLATVTIVIFLVSCNPFKQVKIDRNGLRSPLVEFAIADLEKTITDLSIETNIRVSVSLDNSLMNQSYRIAKKENKIEIYGGDYSGIMYGTLRLAEMISVTGDYSGITDETDSPYIIHRGIKLNIPLDARTPSYDDTGDAAQKNIATMWDMQFWKDYLDELARNRYNLLSLWSLHPYPSMVKVPEYPDVALNDVCVYNGEITSMTDMKWKGEDIQNPEKLTVVKTMTINEKIAFWQQVFEYAENRGIDIYLFHWNVFVMGAEGKHGIEWKQDSPVTVDYIRKSVKQFLLTYPTVKGIGVTAGEHVNRNLTGEYGIENWMWKTYGQGIMDAKAINPKIDVRFIFRRHWSDLDAINEAFKEFDGNMETSFKYSRARMYSSTTPPWFNKMFRETVEKYDVKCWLNLRNDDIFMFRWGNPEYAQEYIKNMPADLSPGFYMGPDGYVWAREVAEKDGEKPYSLDKHWYRFMIWGRTAYNPNLSPQFYIDKIGTRFRSTDPALLHLTWKATSDIISWIDKIHFRQNDMQFAPEGCFDRDKFHDVNVFISTAAMPEQNVISIADYAKNPDTVSITPFEVAEYLTEAGNTLLNGAKKLRGSNNPELLKTLTDFEAMGALGNYYAHKVKGAIYLAQFRVNGKTSDKENAVTELEAALSAWKAYAEAATKNYIPTLLSRTQLLDWNTITKWVEQDIEIAKAAKKGEPVGYGDDNKLWERDERKI